MTSDLTEFEAHLLQGTREMPELKLWQLQGECVGERGQDKAHVHMSACHVMC